MAARHSGLQNKHFLNRLWIFTIYTLYNHSIPALYTAFKTGFAVPGSTRQHRLRKKFWVCGTIAVVRSL